MVQPVPHISAVCSFCSQSRSLVHSMCAKNRSDTPLHAGSPCSCSVTILHRAPYTMFAIVWIMPIFSSHIILIMIVSF